MRHLIVGHHWTDSYNAAILGHYAQALEARGHAVRIHVPRASDLGLVLERKEHQATLRGEYANDVRREHALLAEAEALTLVFPLWWVGPPATIKGWLDRALSFGFAYRYGEDGRAVGLLTGRKAATIVTCGSPDVKYETDGTYAALQHMWDDHVFRICGMEPVGHVWLGNALFAGADERAAHRARVEALAAAF